MGAGPPETQQAYSWGSHASKLTKVLTGPTPHHDVKPHADELERIITWVDLNATYYPSYASAYPEPLRPQSNQRGAVGPAQAAWRGHGHH